jgi:crotonobetainyl-CoA:carnitine CoA-transferase CaiB-like acyl-CoA transferase
VPVADLLGGSLTAAMGLLAALFDAQRTGRGRHVDISIADSTLAHAVVPMVSMLRDGATRRAGTDKLSGGLPCYGLYRTNDGRHLAVGALERKFWDAFCHVLGRDDLKPRHLPPDAAASQALRSELAEIIASQPLAHWQQRFEGTGCCVTPVLRLEEALDDPHFRARGMVVEPPDGAPKQLACPVKMTGYHFELRRPAPSPGEHNDEILAEAGYGTDERAALRAQGAVS